MTQSTTEDFRVEERDSDGEPRLFVYGPLDADNAPTVSDLLVDRMEDGRVLHLDLSGVTFLSSAGVGSLIASVGEYRDQGGDIVMHQVPADVLHVFDLLGLEGFLTLSE